MITGITRDIGYYTYSYDNYVSATIDELPLLIPSKSTIYCYFCTYYGPDAKSDNPTLSQVKWFYWKLEENDSSQQFTLITITANVSNKLSTDISSDISSDIVSSGGYYTVNLTASTKLPCDIDFQLMHAKTSTINRKYTTGTFKKGNSSMSVTAEASMSAVADLNSNWEITIYTTKYTDSSTGKTYKFSASFSSSKLSL